jgi:hypothetical protein
VVDFLAPAEYMVRPPMAPAYLFVLDVSYYAIQSGYVVGCWVLLLFWMLLFLVVVLDVVFGCCFDVFV